MINSQKHWIGTPRLRGQFVENLSSIPSFSRKQGYPWGVIPAQAGIHVNLLITAVILALSWLPKQMYELQNCVIARRGAPASRGEACLPRRSLQGEDGWQSPRLSATAALSVR